MERYNMETVIRDVIGQYTDAELVQICKVLNKTYNVFDSEEMRWQQLKYVLSNTPQTELDSLRNQELSNRLINDLIFSYYHCERVIKYHFIKKLMRLKNHIVAFEMTIGASRVDICRINGRSYAYEIKTEYDSFDRLQTQMEDYCKSFEKVYIVVPATKKEDACKHIPENCGIITYRIDNNDAVFVYSRKAVLNNCDAATCIHSLSNNDLTMLIKILGHSKAPTLKADKIDLLLQYIHTTDIWPAYKGMLRAKYKSRWDFIVTHFDDIIPLDLQSFFSATIDPSIAYYKAPM